MLATALLSACATAPPPATRWSLVVHGGAGVIERANLTPEVEAQYRAAMQRALNTGGAILDRGGSSLDAVEAVIREMEDDPLFNAGRGAVFTAGMAGLAAGGHAVTPDLWRGLGVMEAAARQQLNAR